MTTVRIPDDPLAALLPLPRVQDAVAEARTAVDSLLGHRVLRRGSAEVTAESALRGARASATASCTPGSGSSAESGSSGIRTVVTRPG